MPSNYIIQVSLFVSCLTSCLWLRWSAQGQGIYFQLKGVNYTNNSEVIITDIGSSDDESLLCITDKTDCCENPNRMGEWYFPDMSMVRVNGSGDSFFRNRGPSVVRLHRRHNVMMPTGLFYCEVPDASGVDQRIYITVEGTTITDTSTTSTTMADTTTADTTSTAGTTVAGTTTADTAMASTTTASTTTATENDDINTASMATIKADTTTMPDSPITNPPTALSIGIYFQLHGVNYGNNSIVIITDIGSSDEESLLCITDNTNCCGTPKLGEWYFPNNMSTVRLEGDGGSFFRNRGPSVVRLHRRHNVMMPTGLFYCEVPDASGMNRRIYITVEAMDSPTVTVFLWKATTTLNEATSTTETSTDQDLLIQLRLFEVQNCLEWVNENADAKVEDISVAIISNINQRCQCGLSRENITNGVFRCFPASPQAVTFRAILHRGAKASSSELASYIEHWIGSDVSIPVKSVLTNIDSSCMVIISSFDDRECQVTSEPPTNDNNNMSAAIIGGTVSCLLLFVILAGVMVVGLLWLRKRRLAYSKNMRVSSDQVQANETNISESATHEYEVLDKYSKEYEDVHSVTLKLPPTNPAGHFELTKCPAYASRVPTKN